MSCFIHAYVDLDLITVAKQVHGDDGLIEMLNALASIYGNDSNCLLEHADTELSEEAIQMIRMMNEQLKLPRQHK